MKKEAAILCVVYAFVIVWNGVRRLGGVDEEFIKGGNWDEEAACGWEYLRNGGENNINGEWLR
ncbi:hypothetical protein [Bartonella sp. AD13SXNS]|uniref:hypothetical protein n=1 Tax=Bartonella sp. AD13SXNS TaxID=3243462 RepID=UPI0035D04A80